jgi:hypothetical protein
VKEAVAHMVDTWIQIGYDRSLTLRVHIDCLVAEKLKDNRPMLVYNPPRSSRVTEEVVLVDTAGTVLSLDMSNLLAVVVGDTVLLHGKKVEEDGMQAVLR